MKNKTVGKTLLSPVSLSFPVSYELQGDHIIGRFLGIIPYMRIHVAAVHYLRLATRSEASPMYLLFNWPHFMAHRRSVRPVYVLQTRSRHRIFLKLGGEAHFKLRQAIGRHNTNHHSHSMAA